MTVYYYIFVNDNYYAQRNTRREAFEVLDDYVTNHPEADKDFMFVIEGNLIEYKD